VCCHADDSTLTTPAAGPGLGVHGMSIQSHGEGQVHTGLSPGAQGNTYDQDLVVAQAASSPRAASPSTGGASSIPMASLGPAAAPAASSAASVAAAGSSAGPAAAPTASAAVASVEAAEVFAFPTAASTAPAQTPAGAVAASPADARLSASLVPPSAAAAGTAGQGMSLDHVAQQPSPAGTPRGEHCTQTAFNLKHKLPSLSSINRKS